ncbi:hypothetical protein BBK82_44750 [Lentzea guizhouensis]|uniref:Bacterial transcriptional activator domain-containing protein n=1 Tax=Lentzea guizhouensis TaxID=1586287 RepID=A0A1B2HW93_9PSEU|nr:BTAD domain-containing putative transcriptional regulator [Lentzea guizhouensis]ANZ41994.1 hypothetical protein BBK82_44750 [Lentzea guizhouensis]
MLVEFRVLGPFETLVRAGRVRMPASQKVLLASLVVDLGKTVSVDELAEALWADRPPATYRQQLYKHVSALRELFGENVVMTDETGYSLNELRVHTDVQRFAAAVAQARQLRQDGEPVLAAEQYRAGLSIWRGPALAGIDSESLRVAAARFEEQRLTALEECAELELLLGKHADLVGELRTLTAAHPFRERLAGHLMVALYRCGVQAEALDIYQQLRLRLRDELGVEPSAQLQELYGSLLRQDAALESPLESPLAAQAGPAVVPAGLPRSLPSFTGRGAELASLCTAVRQGAGIAVVSGPRGMGKTALAVHWAHSVRERFPDGQLYLNLRGANGMKASDALTVFLRALGLSAEAVPVDFDAQLLLYRSMLDRQKVLLVLDDVADPAQIEALLPGSSGCFVLITSQSRLVSLTALHDAYQVPLGPLPEDESFQLLEQMLGRARTAADPQAVRELAARCGHVPLSLRVAAASLVEQPDRRTADFVRTLGPAGEPEPEDWKFTVGVRAAFDLSYVQVSADAKTLVRYMAVTPCVDFSLETASALLGTTTTATRSALQELEHTHLIEQHLPGRYRLHDLIKLYARSRILIDDDMTDAVCRLLHCYLNGVDAAVTAMAPTIQREQRPSAPETPFVFSDTVSAVNWLRREHPNLVAAVSWAHEHGQDALCAHLVDALRAYFWFDRATPEWITTGWLGLASAERMDDVRLKSAVHRSLGQAFAVRGELNELTHHYDLALKYADESGDPLRVAYLREAVGVALLHTADVRSAESHFTAAFDAARSYADVPLEISSRVHLIYARVMRGQLGVALTECEEAVSTLRRGHYPYELGHLRGMWGRTLLEVGRLDDALRELELAVDLHAECGDKIGTMRELVRIGEIDLTVGRYDHAWQIHHAAMDLARELDNADMRCAAGIGMAAASLCTGDHDLALALTEDALRVSRQSGNAWRETIASVVGARVLAATGAFDRATDLATSSLALMARHGWKLRVGAAHHVLARIHLAVGDVTEALANAEAARTAHRACGQRLREVQDVLLLAALEGKDQGPLARAMCAEVAGSLADDVFQALRPNEPVTLFS